MRIVRFAVTLLLLFVSDISFSQEKKYNVLLIISDDLTTTALGAYGNPMAKTPHIDRLAREGMVFTRAYSQYPVCGPSRASMLFGYYPSATETFGYVSGREQIGPDRESLPEYFRSRGYYAARVSKIFHMGVPIDIENGSDGTDDPASWTERFNSPGPEWQSPGRAELVQNNPQNLIERKGGNVMTIVQSEGGDLAQSDGKTANKAIELLQRRGSEPFFLAIGFVRPHVPFVAPEPYFQPFPWRDIVPPSVPEGDWDDIPEKGINYVTTINSEMDFSQKQKAIAGYFASVSFMDAQVGKVLKTLGEEGLEENTIIVFTSDHGFHLGEHDFWMKVSLKEESVRVPLIIKVPGFSPGVSESFVELVDLYPTLLDLAGFDIPSRLQGKSLEPILRDSGLQLRDFAFSVTQGGETFLIRNEHWAYIQYGKNAEEGMELFDMKHDPKQFHNLAYAPDFQQQLREMQRHLSRKINLVQENDLGKTYK